VTVVALLARRTAKRITRECWQATPGLPQYQYPRQEEWPSFLNYEEQGKACLVAGLIQFSDEVSLAVACMFHEGWRDGVVYLVFCGIPGFTSMVYSFTNRGGVVKVIPQS
jgi:hypothetical protein